MSSIIELVLSRSISLIQERYCLQNCLYVLTSFLYVLQTSCRTPIQLYFDNEYLNQTCKTEIVVYLYVNSCFNGRIDIDQNIDELNNRRNQLLVLNVALDEIHKKIKEEQIMLLLTELFKGSIDLVISFFIKHADNIQNVEYKNSDALILQQ